MFVARIPNRNSPPAILLRESYREGDKIKSRTLANLSHWPADKINALRRVLKGEELVSPAEQLRIERSLPHGHVAAVLGMARKLGLHHLIPDKSRRLARLALALIVARVIEPAAKLATARQLIEATLAKRHLRDGSLVLYDLTSSYLEGRHCELARHGYSRDSRSDKLQIVFGLLCAADGCPVAVEVFEGNTADPSTLAAQVDKLKARFKLSRVVLVGDRGMITSARIEADLMPAGLDWITALRAPAIRKLAEDGGPLQLSLFDDRDMAEITSPDFPGERLIVCRNPDLADERRRKRGELLAATEKDLARVKAAVQRQRNPLRGKDAIGLKVGAVLGKRKMAKHFHLAITDTSFDFTRIEDAIADEASLDGFYVLRTNVPAQSLDAAATVRAYKSLAQVERAFRTIKTVELEVRPIHHRLAGRVRAHVFLCMLAYYIVWHMRRALAPVLFDDHDRQAAEAGRVSPVAKARVSAAARTKATRKRTHDGRPVHSFRTLLQDLATLTRNIVRIGKDAPAAMLAGPTPIQQDVFNRLGIPIAP